ncbi:MAG: PQQ-binding-like beta-propeller repeat protein [Pirellula sp.]
MQTLQRELTSPITKNSVRELKPLRTWIPILLVPGMALVRFVPGLVENGPSMIWMASAFGPFLIGLLVILWWLFISRASWLERILGVIGIIASIALVVFLADHTMRGPLTIVMTIPMAIAAFAIGLIILGNRLSISRTCWAIVFACLAAGVSTLTKSDGVWGNFAFGLDWRWSTTSEEKLLAARKATTMVEPPAAIPASELTNPDWPSFRGPNQNSAQHGCRISDDWAGSPPKKLWRIAVGPAWSSFTVAGNYLFTQEQLGEMESVVCYDARSGKQVWEKTNKSRFFEALGGLGPRATPTIADGYIYSFGAEGWLSKLNATNGDFIWKVDVNKVSERETLPMWGFSASPLVDNGQVIVHAGGKGDKGIMAFDVNNGGLVWSSSAGINSYGSVQIATLHGKKYLALLSDTGAHFLEPKTGKTMLDYSWKHMGYRSLQPQIVDGDKVLIPTGMGTGTRLIQISDDGGPLQAKELWTSKDMKPDYNDLVIHKGYVYGFDNAIFACIDLKDGKRKWKGGRYEKGQALLLADSDLIVVVSEKGELVLLRADPEKLQELYKISVMDGKTWNHPVVVRDRLYLRNSEEAICFQLPVVSAD